MKKIHFVLFLLITTACTNPKDTKELDTLEITTEQSPKDNNKSSKLLRNIMGTGDGLLRGINFGDPINDVKKLETAELFEEDPEHLGYTYDTNDLETVDILYKNDSDRYVTGIQLDMYMNSKKSNDSLRNEFMNLFTIRYGKPAQQDSLSMTWKIKPLGTVVLKDVSKTRDYGLKINFEKNSK